MASAPAIERFKSGDIIRYSDGVSALFRYNGTHNQGRLYGTHVLGGSHGAADLIFTELQPASAGDIEFCRQHRPEWFAPAAAGEPRQSVMNAEPHAILVICFGDLALSHRVTVDLNVSQRDRRVIIVNHQHDLFRVGGLRGADVWWVDMCATSEQRAMAAARGFREVTVDDARTYLNAPLNICQRPEGER